MSRIRVILDTDPGIDDAFAICYGLGCGQIEIEAMTIIFGNSNNISQLAGNAHRIANLCGFPRIPIYLGSSSTLLGEDHLCASLVHGGNALGDVEPLPPIADGWKPEDESAVDFIIRHCSENPGEITLVTIGPLTNVALAIQKCPHLPSLVRQIVIMGGAVREPLGNKGPVTEANFGSDAEAASLVMRAGFENLVLAGLDVTHKTAMHKSLLSALSLSGPVGLFLSQTAQFYINFYTKIGNEEPPMHDVVPLLYLTHPQIFEKIFASVSVETLGKFTKGMSVIDHKNKFRLAKNATVLLSCDTMKFSEIFAEAIFRLDGFSSTYEIPKMVSCQPRVGVACHILHPNFSGHILIGERLSSHGIGSFACPGGYLEGGESFEECASRETREETGLEIPPAKFSVFFVTNNVMEKDNRHSVTIHLRALCDPDAHPQVMEPTKCSGWRWVLWADVGASSPFPSLVSLIEKSIDPTIAPALSAPAKHETS